MGFLLRNLSISCRYIRFVDITFIFTHNYNLSFMRRELFFLSSTKVTHGVTVNMFCSETFLSFDLSMVA